MIVFEDRIMEIVDLLPGHVEGQNSFPINFYWAKDLQDVNQYLSVKKDGKYPLIILVRGREQHDSRYASEITRKCRFIIACREPDIKKLNTSRWESSYKNTLNPVTKRWLEALTVSSITRLHEGFEIERVPNYADADAENQIDIWDTVVLDCTVSINDNCLKTIKWENL